MSETAKEAQAELFVTTGRLATSPAKIKAEIFSARRLASGALRRLKTAEAILRDAQKRGSRSQIIRAECDVANVHRTLDGLEEEIRELEVELLGEWAPAAMVAR